MAIRRARGVRFTAASSTRGNVRIIVFSVRFYVRARARYLFNAPTSRVKYVPNVAGRPFAACTNTSGRFVRAHHSPRRPSRTMYGWIRESGTRVSRRRFVIFCCVPATAAALNFGHPRAQRAFGHTPLLSGICPGERTPLLFGPVNKTRREISPVCLFISSDENDNTVYYTRMYLPGVYIPCRPLADDPAPPIPSTL